jgi:hypothetical protein
LLKNTFPLLGAKTPDKHFISVDLPAPFAPSNPIKSPEPALKDTVASAGMSP